METGFGISVRLTIAEQNAFRLSLPVALACQIDPDYLNTPGARGGDGGSDSGSGEFKERGMIRVGNRKLFEKYHIMLPVALEARITKLEGDGRTAVGVSYCGRLVGAMGIADRVKPGAKECVSYLQVCLCLCLCPCPCPCLCLCPCLCPCLCLNLRCKGLFLYTVDVLYIEEWCIRQLWCSSILLYNITSISYNYHTDIYPLSNIKTHNVISTYLLFLQNELDMEVWIGTGDSARTAHHVARQLGIPLSRVKAGLLPGDKATLVKWLKKRNRNAMTSKFDL